MTSTEDINGVKVLSIGTTFTKDTMSERHRVRIVIKQIGMLNNNTSIIKKIRATRFITESNYGTFSMHKIVIGVLDND